MFLISARAVIYGVVLLFVFVAAALVISNSLGGDPVIVPFSLVYIAAWILPGYIAARIAGKGGVANGALVGLVAGVVAGGITQLFFNSPPPGVKSSGGFEMGLIVGVASISLCSIGGLLWELHRYLRNRNI